MEHLETEKMRHLHQRTKKGSTRESSIDGTDDRTSLGGVEVHQKVLRVNHIRHDTAVISEQKTSRASKDGKQQIESETHTDVLNTNTDSIVPGDREDACEMSAKTGGRRV